MRLKRYLAPALLGAALLAACTDDPAGPSPIATSPRPRVLGLVEITFTGVGTPGMSARVSPVGALSADARFAVSPGVVGEGGRTGLQTGARTTSTVDAGGQRYLQAVFQVRNASADGVPYTTPRANVSFVPVSTAATLPGTAVLRFLKQDGTAANDTLASRLLPTGAVAANGGGGVASQYPDVLRLFTEAEVAGIDLAAAPSVTNRFPYGFVVRRVGDDTTRSLPANPAPAQFDGAVTFGYRFPLQAEPANNPFTISVVALVVEEAETHVSQSVEEQNPAGRSAFQTRAASLGATTVSILPGGGYTGAATPRQLCEVRTAGTASAPTQLLARCPTPVSSFTVNCHASVTGGVQCDNPAELVLTTSNFQAGGGVLEFDATIQNLLREALGTPNGVDRDTAGIAAVLTGAPTVTGGSGTVSVANPDGERPFLPYFRYDEKLAQDQVSAAKRWRFNVGPGVTSFDFQVTVQAALQPLLVINELLANPGGTVSEGSGEWVEIYNAGSLPVQMEGLVIADSAASGRRPYHRIASPLTVEPGAYVVLGGSTNTTSNGGVPVNYSYGGSLAFANSLDAFKVSRVFGADTVTLDRTQYANASISTQDGISRELRNPALDNANMDGSNWAPASVTSVYGPGGRGTPGAQNSSYTP